MENNTVELKVDLETVRLVHYIQSRCSSTAYLHRKMIKNKCNGTPNLFCVNWPY